MIIKKNRQSNVELLRILAACGVIILHYNNPDFGGGFRFVASGSPNHIILNYFEVTFICAVNIFVLLSGYFMRDLQKRDLLKPIQLLLQWLLFGLLFFFVDALPCGETVTFKAIVSYLAPTYWFVFVYNALYLISPFINLLWRQIKTSEKRILLILMVGLFSVYPTILDIVSISTNTNLQGMNTVGIDGAQSGYTIVQFVVMYLIGCYLKDQEKDSGKKRKPTWYYALLLLMNSLVLLLCTIVEQSVAHTGSMSMIAWKYYNPLVITEAVLFFQVFSSIKIKDSKLINNLAAASFLSYLVHANLLKYCGISEAVKGNPVLMILHVIGCTIAIYLVCYVLFLVYSFLMHPLIAYVDQHWKQHRTFTIGQT